MLLTLSYALRFKKRVSFKKLFTIFQIVLSQPIERLDINQIRGTHLELLNRFAVQHVIRHLAARQAFPQRYSAKLFQTLQKFC